MTEQKIAIIGSGLIGRAWAIAFARGGWRVALYDPETGAAAQGARGDRRGLRGPGRGRSARWRRAAGAARAGARAG